MKAPTLVWAFVPEHKVWHLFVEMSSTGLCGATFQPRQVGVRHLSIRGLRVTACGTCVAMMQELVDKLSTSLAS